MELGDIPARDARDDEIVSWIPFALNIAARHFINDSRFDLDDRQGTALFALVYAHKRFDPLRGVTFGSYAGKVVWDHLRKEAYRRGSQMSRPSVSAQRPELELDQQALASGSHDVYHPKETDLENVDFIEWIKIQLTAQEKTVFREMYKGSTNETIAKRLERFKANRGGVSISRVSKLKRSIREKAEGGRLDGMRDIVKDLIEGMEDGSTANNDDE